MSGEEWRPIPGFPGYEASDRGRIRSFQNRWGIQPTPRLLSMRPMRKNEWLVYQDVRLKGEDGKTVQRRVHRLVLAAFVGPADGRVTRHLNGDGSDNRLANLRYGTQSENAADTVRHGRNPWANRTHCGQGHELTEDNVLWRHDHHGRMCRECKRQASARKNAKRATRQAVAS